MHSLSAQLVGPDQQVLVLHLPAQFTDEWVAPVEREVADRLPRVNNAALILDFRDVRLMNSIAITCVLHLQDACKARGAKLVLAELPEAISRFLSQLKLDRRFTIAPTVDQALVAALNATPR